MKKTIQKKRVIKYNIVMVDFKNFVEQANKAKEEEAKAKKFEPAERITTFKQRIADFYAKIDNEWLQSYIKDGSIRSEIQEITITEEALGDYSVPMKKLFIGDIVLKFVPVGTILIATPGRIDLEYKGRTIMFVLVDEAVTSASDFISTEIRINGEVVERTSPKKKFTGNLVWKFTERGMRVRYQSIDAESFQRLIMGLVQ